MLMMFKEYFALCCAWLGYVYLSLLGLLVIMMILLSKAFADFT